MSAEASAVRHETTPLPSRTARRAGRAMSGLAILFLLFDGLVKLDPNAAVEEAFATLGFPLASAPRVGLLEVLCVLAYALPRTAVLGAVLLTGFLGGATAMHVRVGDPLASHVLFPTYVAVLVWAGLALRDERLRALFQSRPAAARVPREPAGIGEGVR